MTTAWGIWKKIITKGEHMLDTKFFLEPYKPGFIFICNIFSILSEVRR